MADWSWRAIHNGATAHQPTPTARQKREAKARAAFACGCEVKWKQARAGFVLRAVWAAALKERLLVEGVISSTNNDMNGRRVASFALLRCRQEDTRR
jgi:hypothetical protein